MCFLLAIAEIHVWWEKDCVVMWAHHSSPSIDIEVVIFSVAISSNQNGAELKIGVDRQRTITIIELVAYAQCNNIDQLQ